MSWNLACQSAGVPGLLFHDLRRTAVRNLRRAGVAESVIMKITGHRTRGVFERYNITDQSDTLRGWEGCRGIPQSGTWPRLVTKFVTKQKETKLNV